jgi:hypothetical protein
MTETNDDLGRRIASVLDHGARSLEPGTLERLAAARKQALLRHEARPIRAWSWAAATNAGSHGGDWRFYSLRTVLLAAAVAIAIAFGVNWHTGSGPDIAEIDAGLLTDELPINAYLDQSLDSWLKRGSR